MQLQQTRTRAKIKVFLQYTRPLGNAPITNTLQDYSQIKYQIIYVGDAKVEKPYVEHYINTSLD